MKWWSVVLMVVLTAGCKTGSTGSSVKEGVVAAGQITDRDATVIQILPDSVVDLARNIHNLNLGSEGVGLHYRSTADFQLGTSATDDRGGACL